jgi:cbb3-type cytochrome oxidase cytochrome c subunit
MKRTLKVCAISGMALIMLSAFGLGTPRAASADEATKAAIEAGKKVFQREGCSACHTINGQGGTVGPDLTHVGSKKDKAWLKKQVDDPKAHFPNSIMPAFSKLSEKDLGNLVEYLNSLK